ncbi:MAG: tetratricopeptide repeat protein [Ignavibacteria bacterium]|nr:tetratricopeptide repeat protein [Ignavibacteria bacterium]
MKSMIVTILMLLASSNTYSQNQKKLDSLENAMRAFEAHKLALGTKATALIDTTKADILFAIIWEYRNSMADTLPTFALPCLEISQKIGYKKGMANGLTAMGFYYNVMLDYPRCLESHQKALALRRELGDNKGIAYSLQQMGVALIDLGNHAEALSCYFEALKLAEQAGDSIGIARSFSLIAGIYQLQNKNTVALKYYLKSAKILENCKDKELANLRIVDAYGGIAYIYMGMKSKTQEAIDYFRKAIILSQKEGSNYNTVSLMGNLGVAYREHGDNRKAIEIFTSALQLYKSEHSDYLQTDVADMISWLTMLIGVSNERLGNLQEALKFQKLALPHAMRANQTRRAEVYEEFAKIYRKMGNYKNAFEYHTKADTLRDSVAKNVNLEAVNKVHLQNEFNKIQDSTKAEQFKRDAVAENELQKQKLMRNGFIGGFSIMIVFAGFFLFQRNKIKKGKILSDNLLLNILPAEVAEELKTKGTADAKHFDNVTVIYRFQIIYHCQRSSYSTRTSE